MSEKKEIALTEDDSAKFAALPSWQKEFVKRVLECQDILDAAKQAGVARYVGGVVDGKAARRKSIHDALDDGGITRQSIVDHLKECLEAKALRFDKDGNPIEYTDMKLKLAAVDLACKLGGFYEDKAPPVVDPEILAMFRDVEVS